MLTPRINVESVGAWFIVKELIMYKPEECQGRNISQNYIIIDSVWFSAWLSFHLKSIYRIIIFHGHKQTQCQLLFKWLNSNTNVSRMWANLISLNNLMVHHCLCEYEMNVSSMPEKNTFQISISILFVWLVLSCVFVNTVDKKDECYSTKNYFPWKNYNFHFQKVQIRVTEKFVSFYQFSISRLYHNLYIKGLFLVYLPTYCPCIHQCGANWEVIKLSDYGLIMAQILLNAYHECLRALYV